MHDIWNPWHGCRKVSEGCAHCYMYAMDRRRGSDGAVVRRNRTGFDAPLRRNRSGGFHIRSGELIRVCMTSDFFLAEADPWREEAWEVIRRRPDVRFFLLTKRPERVAGCLPRGWGAGWENVALNVSCENQRRADERIPLLLDLPFKHRGVMTAPLLGEIQLGQHLAGGQIEQVIAGGENYEGHRPCDFDWVRALRRACEAHQVKFTFIETGTTFLKDGRTYRLAGKRLQSEMAHRSGMSCEGRAVEVVLTDPLGMGLAPADLHVPRYRPSCASCGSRPICNGCSDCGRCR